MGFCQHCVKVFSKKSLIKTFDDVIANKEWEENRNQKNELTQDRWLRKGKGGGGGGE